MKESSRPGAEAGRAFPGIDPVHGRDQPLACLPVQRLGTNEESLLLEVPAFLLGQAEGQARGVHDGALRGCGCCPRLLQDLPPAPHKHARPGISLCARPGFGYNQTRPSTPTREPSAPACWRKFS